MNRTTIQDVREAAVKNGYAAGPEETAEFEEH